MIEKVKYIYLVSIVFLTFFGTTLSNDSLGQEQQATNLAVKSPKELYLGAVLEKKSINSDKHPVLDLISGNITVSFPGLNIKSKTIKANKPAFDNVIDEALGEAAYFDNQSIVFTIRELTNYESINLFFGQRINLSNYFSIDDEDVIPQTLIGVNIEKTAFTVEMDQPNEENFNTIGNKYDFNNLVYINSISFGRKAIVLVESRLSASVVTGALSVVIAGGELSPKEKAILANCSYRIYLSGEKSDVKIDVNQPLKYLVDYINMSMQRDNYGVPISFRAANLLNGQIYSHLY